MFTDADYPALPYPGARPAFSYVHDHATGWPLTPSPTGWLVDARPAEHSTAAPAAKPLDAWLAERGAAALAERVPVLAYGSNVCPSKLTWLRAERGLDGPVVVIRARCEGIAAVWAAGLRVVDDARPAVLAAVPGASEDHAVLMATPEQVRALDRCEARGERHHLALVRTGQVTLEDGAVLDGVLAYVGATEIRRPLLVEGAMVRCVDQPGEGVAGVGDGLAHEILTGDPDPRAYPGRLFVYGTLQPGASAWDVLAPHAVGTPRQATLTGTLYDTGRGYPALSLGDGPGVAGWVVDLAAPAALDATDEYEGPFYQRVRVATTDGTLCWTYVWTGPPDGLSPMARPWPSMSPME